MKKSFNALKEICKEVAAAIAAPFIYLSILYHESRDTNENGDWDAYHAKKNAKARKKAERKEERK